MDEHAEVIELRRELRVAKMEIEILKRAAAFFARENILPKGSTPSSPAGGDLPVATCCRVMRVSTCGFYPWNTQPCSDRDYDDAVLTNTIVDIHRMSRRSYGAPRVHAELRLDLDTFCSRNVSNG